MNSITSKMKEYYKWDGKKSLLLMSAQKCSDLLLYVCKSSCQANQFFTCKLVFFLFLLFIFFSRYVGKSLFFLAHPSTKSTRTFFSAYFAVTDYGCCCIITPYLSFVNPETKNLLPEEFTGEHWHSQSKGSRNGEYGGLKILLDAESFDFSYTGKDSKGFRIAFTDQRDTAFVRQDGYVISTGEFKVIKIPSIEIIHTT